MADVVCWLMLIYRLPSEPSRLRTAVWRRLKALGAVYVANSVAVLPESPEAERALRGLRAEVEEMGGAAQLVRAEPLTGQADFTVRYNQARDEEYAEVIGDPVRAALLRRGFALEYATLAWNVIGIVVLAIAAVSARSVALAGFGLDSLIEIGASTVVIWELSGTGEERQRRGLRLIGCAFAALAIYLLVQSTLVLATGYHPRHSPLGIAWTALTAAVMFALAAGKARTGRALDNRVLRTEGRVTLIDGILAAAVLAGLVLNAARGWWWADPAAGYVLVYYAAREVREIFTGVH